MRHREEEKKYGKIGNMIWSMQVLEHLLQQVRLSERRDRLGALLRHDKAEVGHSDGERRGAGRGDWEQAGTKWEAWEVLGVCRQRNATVNTCTHLTRVVGCCKSAGLTSRSVVAPLNQTTSTWDAKAKQGVYRLAVMWQ